MAIACPLVAASLLLFSLLVIASANDYGVYDSSKTQAYDYGTAKPVNQQQPENEQKPGYGSTSNVYKSQPEEKGKPLLEATASIGYGTSTKPVYQPEAEKPATGKEEQPDYGTKPSSYKPQPDREKEKPVPKETEKPDHGTQNNFYQQQPEEKEKPDYGTNPNFNTPQPEEQPKYNANPTTDFNKPNPEVLPIGVEGLVLCKSGPKYYPIRGALTRITCLTVDENGYEKTHSVCSGETDEKGYFLARLSPPGLVDDVDLSSKLGDCKAFLESSPLETCNVPVDVNKGISGAPLSGFRVLHHSGMKLFTVGPFFFTSESNPVPNGY
ncbi:hypothetical protein V6N13_045375 [Hibiscus sabdariffa]|uniref:Uncharacterized protein n=1 Tax=Hibiscus sabdariffa TaxID=183260 RepID=A0ABR2RKW6_9ROSI